MDIVLVVLSALVLILGPSALRIWHNHVTTNRSKWIDEQMTQRIEEAVFSSMGAARKAKDANKDGKLSALQRTDFTKAALDVAIKGVMSTTGLSGEQLDKIFHSGDLEKRVASAVIRAKMSWAASGLAAMEESRETAQFLEQVMGKIHDQTQDPDAGE